jgi:hypothetical protein
LTRHALSPYLIEALVRLGTEMAFERAPEVLSFFTRVGIGEETARRITEQAGAVLHELEEAAVIRGEQEQRPDIGSTAASADVHQVSADGAMVHLVNEGWVEVRTLAIGRIMASLQGEVHAREVSYFSRLDTAEGFRRFAAVELCRRGTYAAGTVCAVFDGAEWLQKFADWHVPKAIRILDFPHAAEHVNLAVQAVFGRGTAEASEWLGTALHELRHGDPDRVLAALRALPTAKSEDPPTAARVRDEVLAYLEKRRSQIAYAQFGEAGYPIGSGMVESANKLVVEARLKRSGMHWARLNVNPMLALRAVACSGRWKQSWPHIWHRLCARAARPLQAPTTDVPTDANSTSESTRPPKPPAQLTLEKRGLVKNGRPTRHHPWRAPLTRRAATSARS